MDSEEKEVILPELPEGYTAVKTDDLMLMIEQNQVMKEEIATLVSVISAFLPAVKGKNMTSAISSITRMAMSGSLSKMMEPLFPIIDKYATEYAETSENSGQ